MCVCLCLHTKWAHIDNVADCAKWRPQFMAATCRIELNWYLGCCSAVRATMQQSQLHCCCCYCCCSVDLIVSGQKLFATFWTTEVVAVCCNQGTFPVDAVQRVDNF